MKIKPGFRGIARINGSSYFRFSTADVQLKQDGQPFLPAYGGKDLKQIWHIGTGDVTGSITAPVIEGNAEAFYDLARNQEEFYLDLNYYGQETRRVTGCRVDLLSFTCNAGEIAQMSMNIIGKEVKDKVRGFSYTKGEKLVTWDKCLIDISGYSGDDGNFQGFSYSVNNGFKSIKTAKSLTPHILSPAIQDVSGQFTLYNVSDLIYPERGAYEYGLGFRQATFKIDDLNISHEIVIHPTENIPLTVSSVVSTISWTRHDDFNNV